MGSRALDLARLPQEPTPLRAARSARDLANALNADITSVREVGGLGVYLAQAVREGLLDGPSIYAAGAVLSTTGGHGDLHSYPLPWMHDFGHHDGGRGRDHRARDLPGRGSLRRDARDRHHPGPTRTIIENILANLDKVPPYAAAKLTAVADTHADMVRMAIELGVTIAMGTDLGLTGLDLPGAWGTNGTELVHLVALGMTPRQAIEAATATAPRTLGPQAPRSGLLAEGYDADLITVDGDPLADIPCWRIRAGSRRSGSADARSKAPRNRAEDPAIPASRRGTHAGRHHELAEHAACGTPAPTVALAADWLSRGRGDGGPARIGFFGAGVIARYIHTFLSATGWTFDEIGGKYVYDEVAGSGELHVIDEFFHEQRRYG